MKFTRILFILLLCSNLNSFGQVSPFGTGAVKNVTLGVLNNGSVVFPSNSGYGNGSYFPNPDDILTTYTFDLYIPPGYDGSEAYGLVTWINSGNGGGVIGSWTSVLNDKKLIWVGGDNIGNSVNINIRMGVAWAAVYKMLELYNIDQDRIYTAGRSGGARMANTLAYIYPEWIDASLPLCGGSFPQTVAQDYETQNPDGNYELIINFNQSKFDYIKTFNQKVAWMTSFNDFREGDIMNIYHNGAELNNMQSKFLERPGGHCATSGADFLDAVNFVEHSFSEDINDDFSSASPAEGSGYISQNVELGTNEMLLNSNTAIAQIKTKDVFNWKDPKGAIIKTKVSFDETNGSINNNKLHLGLWEYQNKTEYCSLEGNEISNTNAAILLSFDFSSENPMVDVTIRKNGVSEVNRVLFSGELSDWSTAEYLNIKYHLWNNELRIELSNHFVDGSIVATGAMLLDDKRSIRLRWNDIADSFWSATEWQNGAFLTLANESISSTTAAATTKIKSLECISEVPAAELTFTNLTVVNQSGNSLTATSGLTNYQWYLNGVLISGENSNTIMNAASGNYYATAIDSEGCLIISNIFDATTLSIGENEFDTSFKVYPNPSNDYFYVSVPKIDVEKVKIFDTLDRNITNVISLFIENSGLLKIDLSNQRAGLYLISVSGKTKILLKR